MTPFNWLISILFLLLITLCYGGVDFTWDNAMQAQKVYDIPIFHSKGEAFIWSNKVKWIEPLRVQLKNRVYYLRGLYRLENNYEMAEYYNHQSELCEYALRIVENYRRHGVEGDPAQIGSLLFIGEIPLRVK